METRFLTAYDQDLDNSVIIPRLISFLCPAKTKHAAPRQREDEAELCLQIAVHSFGSTQLTVLMLLLKKQNNQKVKGERRNKK